MSSVEKMQSFGSMVLAAGVLGLASVATAAPAPIVYGNAIYTARNDTPRPGELSHAQILEHLYGGTFTPTGAHGLDFTNGEILIKRIADDIQEVMNVTAIGQTQGVTEYYTDQFWQDQFLTVEAQARFATYTQNFGLIPQEVGGDYVQLLNTMDWKWGFGADEQAVVPDLNGATFRWARGGENGVWNSDPSQNRDGLDHLITYKVVYLNDTDVRLTAAQEFKTFLLFWEDQSDTDNVHPIDIGDWDFNDLVVEVRAQYNSIPEPASLGVIAGGMALLGLRRRR